MRSGKAKGSAVYAGYAHRKMPQRISGVGLFIAGSSLDIGPGKV